MVPRNDLPHGKIRVALRQLGDVRRDPARLIAQ
jgi:hypothetical protein